MVAAASSLLHFEETPSFMRTNKYIRRGYRPHLSAQLCIRSLFWWTNETLNIWTHIGGCAFFVLVAVYDVMFIIRYLDVTFVDLIIYALTLLSFQFCLVCSAAYHMFKCHSESACEQWLFWDLLGVTVSLTFIFISGVHFAFHCFPMWHAFYIATVTALFAVATGMQLHPVYRGEKYFYVRLAILSSWVSYGVVPTIHWSFLLRGFGDYLVQMFLPRVGVMFVLIGLAFFFYMTKYPEKLWPGRVDYIGSSHQWWHLLVVVAFYWWHNTGLMFAQHRKSDQCLLV